MQVWVGLMAAATLSACGTDAQSTTVSPSVCKSEIQWTGGDEKSPLMHPGKDCVACHAERGEGPEFAIAGTVYPDMHEADDCYGEAGVKVVITGSDGKEFTLTANASGNFFMEKKDSASLKLPYTAKVVSGNKENAMGTAQVAGSCNSCHTKAGTGGAPGRITVP
ncbi:MAG: hypothetical protein H6747_00545 [Deltaproteobacteria bacterium]|nr:hypothetical protein [Deltaproteobacteria bacterium]